MPRPKRLTLVYAAWCPHCEPLSREEGGSLALALGVPLRVLDIDVPEEERDADRIVAAYGDDDPDYLIPQLFLEREDGTVEHLLTGVPGPIDGTRQRWAALLERATGASAFDRAAPSDSTRSGKG